MLTQAVCETIWVLDTSIAGVDLTEPFAELLTVEARLALADDGTQPGDTATSTDQKEVTYYRRARALAGLLADLEESWPRLAVERPYGPLPLERHNPTSTGGGRVVTSNIWCPQKDSNASTWLRRPPGCT
jgi:hypothetical protein